jgi:hypothetical protein
MFHQLSHFSKNASVRQPKKWPSQIVSNIYADKNFISRFRNDFYSNGYAKLPKFLTSEVFAIISDEVKKLHFTRFRKDFVMPSYNTDRKMSVISGKEVVQSSRFIAELYSCRELREVISLLIGTDIHTVHHEDEFLVVNFLDGKGDTHGWHLDDPRYALVVIVESPPPGAGGFFEYIPNWNWLAREENFDPVLQIPYGVQIAKNRGLLQSDNFESSDCYLLDAAKVLHRVSPMLSEGKRKALNLAFDDRRYRIYGNTATRLYG